MKTFYLRRRDGLCVMMWCWLAAVQGGLVSSARHRHNLLAARIGFGLLVLMGALGIAWLEWFVRRAIAKWGNGQADGYVHRIGMVPSIMGRLGRDPRIDIAGNYLQHYRTCHQDDCHGNGLHPCHAPGCPDHLNPLPDCCLRDGEVATLCEGHRIAMAAAMSELRSTRFRSEQLAQHMRHHHVAVDRTGVGGKCIRCGLWWSDDVHQIAPSQKASW